MLRSLPFISRCIGCVCSCLCSGAAVVAFYRSLLLLAVLSELTCRRALTPNTGHMYSKVPRVVLAPGVPRYHNNIVGSGKEQLGSCAVSLCGSRLSVPAAQLLSHGSACLLVPVLQVLSPPLLDQ
jgi:hypothetical protein